MTTAAHINRQVSRNSNTSRAAGVLHLGQNHALVTPDGHTWARIMPWLHQMVPETQQQQQ
jgi:hypothetical protein